MAIDAGQSTVKLRHTENGRSSEWTVPGIRTDRPLPPQLIAIVAQAAADGRAFEQVALGVSGLESGGDESGLLLEATRAHGVSAVHLAHDSITAFLGTLGDGRGAVVAAGTGVVTLAVGRTEVARVDGWGHLIGDAGSGFWIGRAAFDAVMRAHDGRGEATALTALLAADFPDLERAYLELQTDPDRVSRTAAYARTVAEAAADGDAVAAAILERAGRELALSAVAGLRRTGEAEAAAPRVRGIGGMFGAEGLAAAFVDETRALLPDADVGIGDAAPLDGAHELPRVDPGSALAAHIAVARTLNVSAS
nr:BadF/BadG/BcrA/BcrD ATPase family protein [Glycomyces sp. NRRL B-16210]